MPVCGNYLFFELPKKIVLNPKDGAADSKGQEEVPYGGIRLMKVIVRGYFL